MLLKKNPTHEDKYWQKFQTDLQEIGKMVGGWIKFASTCP